ncbi:MAG: trypsin-like peptidase domain-containing protein [Pirellulaceae bacterium]
MMAACPQCGLFQAAEASPQSVASSPPSTRYVFLAVAAVLLVGVVGALAGLTTYLNRAPQGIGPRDISVAGGSTAGKADDGDSRSVQRSSSAVEAPPVAELLARGALIDGGSAGLRYRWEAGRDYRYSIDLETRRGGEVSSEQETVHYTVAEDERSRLLDELLRGEATGTGFVVHADGYLVTCAHVVFGAKQVEVFLNGRSYDGAVVALDTQHDLAVVHVEARGLPTLALATAQQVKLGQDVQSIGYPLTDEASEGVKVTRGAVSGYVVQEGCRFVQVDAAFNPGVSGGPVVGPSGEVIGVASRDLGLLTQNANLAVTCEDVIRLLRRCNIGHHELIYPSPQSNVEVVKQVVPSVALLKVTAGPGGVGMPRHFTLECSYSPAAGKQPSRGLLARLFTGASRERGELVVDEFGETDSDSDTEERELPHLLGPLAQLAIPPLSPRGEKTWSSESLELIPLDSHQGAKFVLARGTSTFRVQSESSEQVVIKQVFRLRAPQDEKQATQYYVLGEGEFVFDPKQGVIKSYVYKARHEQTARFPHLEVTVRLTLLDEQNSLVAADADVELNGEQIRTTEKPPVEATAGEPAASSTSKPAETPDSTTVARAESTTPETSTPETTTAETTTVENSEKKPPAKPLSEEELRSVLRRIQQPEFPGQEIIAMRRLAKAQPTDDVRGRVVAHVDGIPRGYAVNSHHLPIDRERTAAAIEVLGVWGGPIVASTLIDIIQRSKGDDEEVLREAVRALCRLKTDGMLMRVLDPDDPVYNRGRGVNALPWAGEDAEAALLRLAAHWNRTVRLRALRLLPYVGGSRSVAELTKIAEDNADDTDYRSRVLAVQREIASYESSPDSRPVGDIVKLGPEPASAVFRPRPATPRPEPKPFISRPRVTPRPPVASTPATAEPPPLHPHEIFRSPQLRWTIYSLAISPDARFLAVGKMDRKLLMFDVEKDELVASLDDLTVLNSVTSLAFTHDGEKLLAGGGSGVIWIFDVGESGELQRVGTFAGHASAIQCMAVSRDNRFVVSGERDKRLRCWSLDTTREQWTVAMFSGTVQATAFTADGAAALATDGKSLLRIDVKSGEVTSTRTLSGFSHSSAISPDGARVACSDGRAIRTWNTDSGEQLSVYATRELQWAMSFSPAGDRVVAGGNNVLSVVDVESGDRLAALPLSGIGYTKAVAYSDDGRFVAGIGTSQRIASFYSVEHLEQAESKPSP